MPHLADKNKCNGCHACYNTCNIGAIKMQADDEGFLHPVIDNEKCINCGRCEKACPIINPPANNPYEESYGAYAKDETIHKTSSSGGVFAVLAKETLKNGGFVCGAAYTPDRMVKHIIIDKEDDLHLLQGSKYVQSAIGDIYSKIKDLLIENKKVLFSGTPCQVAGLVSYLGKDYDNLITLDLICHGVPSPWTWQLHLNEISGGKAVNDSTFRNKTQGIHNVTLDYYLSDGTVYQEKYEESPYIKAFSQNLSVRPSCFECKFKGYKRCSDITIGDYWSAVEYNPKLVQDNGVSAIILHSEKSKPLFEKYKKLFVIENTTGENISLWNTNINNPAATCENRETFFNDIKELVFSQAVEKNYIEPVVERISVIRKIYGKLIRIYQKHKKKT